MLSYVTLTFDDEVSMTEARPIVLERLRSAELPAGVEAVLGPLATPIGEIYRYTLAGSGKDPLSLRTTQDWIVRPALLRVPGVADVISLGGMVREIHVEPDPSKMASYGVQLDDVFGALQKASENASGGFIECGAESFVIRSLGTFRDIKDIAMTRVTEFKGVPVHMRDIAAVTEGYAPRQSFVSRDAQEDVVEGIVLMRKGENPSEGNERQPVEHGRSRLWHHCRWRGDSGRTPLSRDSEVRRLNAVIQTNRRCGATGCSPHAVLAPDHHCGLSSDLLAPTGGRQDLCANGQHGGQCTDRRDGNELHSGAGARNVRFIALLGQAVLNGVLVVAAIRARTQAGEPPFDAVWRGSIERLRAILMTALLAALGLVPAAMSHAIGSETQQPIAVVVVGGTLTAAALTLVVLPVSMLLVLRAEQWFARRGERAATQYHADQTKKRSTA